MRAVDTGQTSSSAQPSTAGKFERLAQPVVGMLRGGRPVSVRPPEPMHRPLQPARLEPALEPLQLPAIILARSAAVRIEELRPLLWLPLARGQVGQVHPRASAARLRSSTAAAAAAAAAA